MRKGNCDSTNGFFRTSDDGPLLVKLVEKRGNKLFILGGHPKPAIGGHFKTGQR